MTDRRCILVVEDEPLVAEVVVDALGDTYRTIAVDAAAEALEHIRLGGIDLVLLDYLLPGGGSSQVLASNCCITIILRPVQMLVMYAVVPAMW